jgi:DNA invertase Pin-like site-specific DNA recombinase
VSQPRDHHYVPQFLLSRWRKLIRDGKTPTEAATLLGIGRATLYRALQNEAA